MTAEELRIKSMRDYTEKLISEYDDLSVIVKKVEDFARETWKDFPKDVNFLAYSRVRCAEKLFEKARG